MSLHEKIVFNALLSCLDFQMILFCIPFFFFLTFGLFKKNQFLNKAENSLLMRIAQNQKVSFPEAYACFACKCRS